MARSSVIKVSFLGDASDLQKTFKATETGAEKWSGRMSSAGKAMTLGLTAPIVAGAGLAIKAAAEEQQQIETLAGVIEQRIPGATREMIDANEEWVSNLQSSIAVADGEIRELEQRFIAAGSSVEDAQRLTELAYNTAAQTGKDATSIADAFVKAQNGQVAGLSRLGIQTKKANGETKSFLEIQEELADTMGGSAARAADTAAGRAELLQLTLADLSESIGSMLLPIFEKLVGWAQQAAEWFGNLSPAGQRLILMIAGVVAAVGPMLIIGAKLVQSFTIIKQAWQGLNLAFSITPWGAVIAALVIAVTLIIANWDKVKTFLLATWEAIKNAARVVWDWIKNTVKSAVDFIVNVFKNFTLPGLIMKHWETIKRGVETLKGWITGTWDSIIAFFKGIPGRISSAVGGLFDGIKNAFRSAVNWVIDKWNGLRFQIGPLKIPSWIPGIGGKEIKLSLNTPNIPRLHDGGVFRAQGGFREGLAMLKDGETVLPPGARGGGPGINIVINAGLGADGRQIGRLIVEELQKYERANGMIPIGVRGV